VGGSHGYASHFGNKKNRQVETSESIKIIIAHLFPEDPTDFTEHSPQPRIIERLRRENLHNVLCRSPAMTGSLSMITQRIELWLRAAVNEAVVCGQNSRGRLAPLREREILGIRSRRRGREQCDVEVDVWLLGNLEARRGSDIDAGRMEWGGENDAVIRARLAVCRNKYPFLRLTRE
jgi:hypothetical protein